MDEGFREEEVLAIMQIGRKLLITSYIQNKTKQQKQKQTKQSAKDIQEQNNDD